MSDETRALLRVLVEGDARAVAEALHADVVFVQGDGTEHRGADVVVAMFERGDDGARYAVVAAEGASVRVELTVMGMPGAVRFTLHGAAESGRLVVVRVEA
ncbi:MAG: hypothetical protein JWM10_934 [Myxococcaceae bacterium]|nr:hypothetical protein [Myxococcaceae bacterium]